MKPRSRYTIEALSRGLEVLSLFRAENPSLSLTQIVTAMRSSKSTIFRVLSTLETMGYLEHDPATRRYAPALKVLQLGFTAINGLEVRQVARPYLERLAIELDETVSLGVLDGLDLVYVDRVRNHAIVGVLLNIGSHLPAHCTALGKVLMAALPPDELDRRLASTELASLTPDTITDPAALRSELSRVRKQGYALCDGDLAVGLRAVGAPIRNYGGKAIAAINVTGSEATISLQRLENEIVPALLGTAARISLALGYPGDAG